MNRKSAFPRRQTGLSLIGLLFFGIIAVMLVVLGMRVMPSALEYFAIKRAVNGIATSGAGTPAEIQRAFERQAAIDDFTSVSGRDLLIERNDSGVSIGFRYEKRVPLFGPVSLLIEYEGNSAAK